MPPSADVCPVFHGVRAGFAVSDGHGNLQGVLTRIPVTGDTVDIVSTVCAGREAELPLLSSVFCEGWALLLSVWHTCSESSIYSGSSAFEYMPCPKRGYC